MVLINPVLFSAEKPNELLRRLTNLCNELGLELNDHFPVCMFFTQTGYIVGG